jgi:hypothetical protein
VISYPWDSLFVFHRHPERSEETPNLFLQLLLSLTISYFLFPTSYFLFPVSYFLFPTYAPYDED